MNIDWTINLGNILSILAFLGSAGIAFVSAYFQLKNMEMGIKNINNRMDKVDEELKKQTEILINQARQSERISALEKRIDDVYDRFHPTKIVMNAQQQPN